MEKKSKLALMTIETNPKISIISININELTLSVMGERLLHWIHKVHLRAQGTSKSKGWKRLKEKGE